MKIFLVNVGANVSHQSYAKSPLFSDGGFVYVPFPNLDGKREARPYPTIAWPFTKNLDRKQTHADPDWLILTYGGLHLANSVIWHSDNTSILGMRSRPCEVRRPSSTMRYLSSGVLEELASFIDAPVFRDGNVIRIPALREEVAKHNTAVQAWCDKYGCE